MKSKEELKKLFENGDKPTQEEFWEWQDSYWHKDEKLPTEVAGIYKIKGSVANLAALNVLTSMEEGDVYNLLDTGDNYVYVLDLNNTGVAGWDKLSGIVDLSTVDLQTVLDNGGYASMGRNSIFMNLDNGGYNAEFFYSTDAGTRFTHSSQEIAFQSYYSDLTNTRIDVQKGGFKYREDYSQRPEFGDRNLVDKGYVDTVIASIPTPSINLQSVLDSGNTANKPNASATIDLDSKYFAVDFLDSTTQNHSNLASSTDFAHISWYNNGTPTKTANRIYTDSSGSIVECKSQVSLGYNYAFKATPIGLFLSGIRDVTGNTSFNKKVVCNDNGYLGFVDKTPERTRGTIDSSSFTFIDGAHITNGFLSYEHEEGSSYCTIRLRVSGSLSGSSPVIQAILPFDVGFTTQRVLPFNNNYGEVIVDTKFNILTITKIADEDVSFSISQCLTIPYGFESDPE